MQGQENSPHLLQPHLGRDVSTAKSLSPAHTQKEISQEGEYQEAGIIGTQSGGWLPEGAAEADLQCSVWGGGGT